MAGHQPLPRTPVAGQEGVDQTKRHELIHVKKGRAKFSGISVPVGAAIHLRANSDLEACRIALCAEGRVRFPIAHSFVVHHPGDRKEDRMVFGNFPARGVPA